MSRYAKLGVSAMFMAGVLFMLGVIACCIAVNLAIVFWPIVLGVLFVLAVGLAAVIAPEQVVPVLVGLPVLALFIFLVNKYAPPSPNATPLKGSDMVKIIFGVGGFFGLFYGFANALGWAGI